MSIPNGYLLGDLHRVLVRSWLSTILFLYQRVRDSLPLYAIGRLPAAANKDFDDLHVNDGIQQGSHAGPSLSSSTDTPSAGDEPVTDHRDTPDQLSMAIEVKFLVPILKPGTEDSGFPHDKRPITTAAEEDEDDMQALIRRTHESVASTISQTAGTAARHGQQSVVLHDIVAAQRLERHYWETHWIVKKANSALPTASEDGRGSNYIWIPVEVCSPKQKWNDTDGLESSLRTLSAVLCALTQNHRVTVNHTCDVHVHVGRADGRHLSLTTLKRLATMLWFSEDAIRSVRDPTSPNYHNVFTWGAEMTRHSRLALLVGSKVADNPLSITKTSDPIIDSLQQQSSAIQTIWKADSHLQLGKLLSGSTPQYRRLGFNFSCLGREDRRARNGPKTIEFRVLEGTLHTDVVPAWVAICWKLVEVAGAAGGHDDRLVRVIKACLGHVDRNGQSRLMALVVDGLGIGRDRYDAFSAALRKGRESRRM